MATRGEFIPYAAEFPTSNFPGLGKDAQARPYLAFDAATDETCRWTKKAPQGLTGTLTFYGQYYMATATTGNIRFQVQIEAVTPGDATDLDAGASFDTANSGGQAVPGTAGYLQEFTVTCTNADSIAAGDYFRLSLNRDADGTSGTDDAAGDCHFLIGELRDTA